MVGLLLRIFGCATGAATVRYFFMIVDPLFSLDTRRLGCWGGGWEPNFLRAPGQKKIFFLENPESWVFRIPGVFGEKSGPYSTIFLWGGFPFGGQKQGQNTPKLVLFEFLVTRAFSGGTIKKNWRGCIAAQCTVHTVQYTQYSTQYTVEERGCPPEAKILFGGSSCKEENVFFVLFYSIPVHGHLIQ